MEYQVPIAGRAGYRNTRWQWAGAGDHCRPARRQQLPVQDRGLRKRPGAPPDVVLGEHESVGRVDRIPAANGAGRRSVHAPAAGFERAQRNARAAPECRPHRFEHPGRVHCPLARGRTARAVDRLQQPRHAVGQRRRTSLAQAQAAGRLRRHPPVDCRRRQPVHLQRGRRLAAPPRNRVDSRTGRPAGRRRRPASPLGGSR